MTKSQANIETSADAMENAAISQMHENIVSEAKGGRHEELPKALKESTA